MNNSKSTEITNEKLEETKVETCENIETKTSVTDFTNESGNSEITKESAHEIKMDYIDKDFCYDLMSIPTVSNEEYRLVTYIILWARRNGVKYEFDEHGNIYLTKGVLKEGEYYPCVTAHLDTVQTKQQGYAQAGCRLDVKTRYVESQNHHEIYVDGMGIGGDDKAGVLIGLSMFKHCEKLKAAFFLCEEKGCIGSNAMDVSKLDNVGYVMGFDSPELNRAAYACSGVRLFSKDFFETYMKDVCKAHGLTDFRSEPFTDVKVIRDKTNIMCMNFGSGYYYCHMPNEYCVLEEMDNACKMGVALVNKIGNTKHEYEYKSSSDWTKNENGTWIFKKSQDDDEDFFRSLDSTYKRYQSYSYTNNNYTSSKSSCNQSSSTYCKDKSENNGVSKEQLEYVVSVYKNYINSIKENIKSNCENNNIDFNIFENSFNTNIQI